MPLSKSEKAKLLQEYANQQELVLPVNQVFWVENKERIIDFCVENDIYLYNIGTLKISTAIELLNDLIKHLEKQNIVLWENNLFRWKEVFNQKLAEVKNHLFIMHNNAYVSVADQFKKTKKLDQRTLLTVKDLFDLLDDSKFESQNLLRAKPFSLTELSLLEIQNLRQLIKSNPNKDLFLPVHHDGHWFYLLRSKGAWSLQDSQPFSTNKNLTPRQESM
ncbi:Uncharacterised protein [Legionella busanensis]|uniref:Uncharacterized protein n=1 Tax=Legionella busanensis TaxID=190655 RepID=A0A378K9I1_9GAMM|nr:hypothetical protein [Legionella busanensis]STX81366.1 Uncharacterised protein [Legionella busanensis]